jgi:hypothetical protein
VRAGVKRCPAAGEDDLRAFGVPAGGLGLDLIVRAERAGVPVLDRNRGVAELPRGLVGALPKPKPYERPGNVNAREERELGEAVHNGRIAGEEAGLLSIGDQREIAGAPNIAEAKSNSEEIYVGIMLRQLLIGSAEEVAGQTMSCALVDGGFDGFDTGIVTVSE